MLIGKEMRYIGKLYIEHSLQTCKIIEYNARGLCTVEFENGEVKLVVSEFLIEKIGGVT